jgi:hypothetical protein
MLHVMHHLLLRVQRRRPATTLPEPGRAACRCWLAEAALRPRLLLLDGKKSSSSSR